MIKLLISSTSTAKIVRPLFFLDRQSLTPTSFSAKTITSSKAEITLSKSFVKPNKIIQSFIATPKFLKSYTPITSRSSRFTSSYSDKDLFNELNSNNYEVEEPKITKCKEQQTEQTEILQNEVDNNTDTTETLEKIINMKVNRLVRGIINTFIKDKKLWIQLKDNVELALNFKAGSDVDKI
ncbi:hypothetical protein C1645_839905 [Glomus cerebriforme]|uniref:Uncharacterized protein n=1 Tax=Glomus cerebriforme TaxID=658196 RepID=A0A397RZZ2_9GLOM|nr:hypothetical protein C1645_839905 [Glomus cerebriforme]